MTAIEEAEKAINGSLMAAKGKLLASFPQFSPELMEDIWLNVLKRVAENRCPCCGKPRTEVIPFDLHRGEG